MPKFKYAFISFSMGNFFVMVPLPPSDIFYPYISEAYTDIQIRISFLFQKVSSN